MSFGLTGDSSTRIRIYGNIIGIYWEFLDSRVGLRWYPTLSPAQTPRAPEGPSPQWSSSATQMTSPCPESVQGSFRLARRASEKISLSHYRGLNQWIESRHFLGAFAAFPGSYHQEYRFLTNFTVNQFSARSD